VQLKEFLFNLSIVKLTSMSLQVVLKHIPVSRDRQLFPKHQIQQKGITYGWSDKTLDTKVESKNGLDIWSKSPMLTSRLIA